MKNTIRKKKREQNKLSNLPSSSGSGIWVSTTKPNGLCTVHVAVDLLFRVHVKARHEVWIKGINVLLFSSTVHSLHVLLLVLSENDIVSFGTTLWFRNVVLRMCQKKTTIIMSVIHPIQHLSRLKLKNSVILYGTLVPRKLYWKFFLSQYVTLPY